MTTNIEKDFQDLVYHRLQSLPPDTEMSIGGIGELSRDDLLNHVKKLDDIGKTIINVEKDFFDALKTGELYRELYEPSQA
ncbi:hypothetical protein FWF48_04060 [Candidatus Saccharibacteria bacterium]|nr:hypothetical protein [Candidatus Saccharibacteria bacterium]